MNNEDQAPQDSPDIDMEVLISEWEKSKKFRDNYTRDFRELDNLVDGAPLTREGTAPFVGDTTLAGLVRSIPRASLQQLPLFSVAINGTKNSINSLVASYLLRAVVFNEDTFGKGILSTMQIGAEQALTHGYAPFMTATGSMYDEFGTSMRLMHYVDVAPERGIQSDNESLEWFVEADVTPSRLDRIIAKAEMNPDTSWNVPALKALRETEPEGTDYQQYASDPRRVQGADSGVYRFVTNYQVGKGGKFITFCNQHKEAPLRVLDNKSKFGYPRVQFLVIDPAPLTPFGVSRVRLASPNQNLMNAYYMNVMSMLIINSDPPILQRGRFTTPVQLKRKAKWETIDQNATAELVTIDNGALNQFVPMLKQFSAQIQNMMGSAVGNADGGSNSLGFSKTAPGVKMQQDFMSLSTNQLTNILENFLRQYALVALDTYICEQEGDYELTLDDEAKTAINRFIAEKNAEAFEEYALGMQSGEMLEEPTQIPLIGEDNKFTINWESFYESIQSWRIEIELSMGKDELEEKTRQDLQDTLVTLMQNDDGSDPEIRQRAKEILDKLLEKTDPTGSRLNTNAVPAPAAPAQAVPSGEVEAPAPTQ